MVNHWVLEYTILRQTHLGGIVAWIIQVVWFGYTRTSLIRTDYKGHHLRRLAERDPWRERTIPPSVPWWSFSAVRDCVMAACQHSHRIYIDKTWKKYLKKMLYESVGHSSSQTSAFLIIAWAKIHSGLPVFKTQLELQEWVQLSCLVALLFEFQPLNKVALNTPNTRVENWVNEEITWPSSTPVAICSTIMDWSWSNPLCSMFVLRCRHDTPAAMRNNACRPSK